MSSLPAANTCTDGGYTVPVSRTVLLSWPQHRRWHLTTFERHTSCRRAQGDFSNVQHWSDLKQPEFILIDNACDVHLPHPRQHFPGTT